MNCDWPIECPGDRLPFATKCEDHINKHELLIALKSSVSAYRSLAEVRQELADLRRATAVYRVMSPFVLVTGALVLLAMLGQIWR